MSYVVKVIESPRL